MPKEYTLIHPDIDMGSGRTRELISELARAFSEGSTEGGAEICSLVRLLSSDEELPFVGYLPREGGALQRLSSEFASFIMASADPNHPLFKGMLDRCGESGLRLFVGGFASATGALTAAMINAGVAGGEVITSSLNYAGVPNAISLAGAVPRFADVDPKSFCLDPTSVESMLSPKTKAILLTHLNRFVDLEPFDDLMRRRGLEIPLIQDASLAAGSCHNGVRPGLINLGPNAATVISLATSKTISGLGGAILLTNDLEVLRATQTMAYQGMDFDRPQMLCAHGMNLKMNEMHACIALEQLKQREEIFVKRRALKMLYDRYLAPELESGAIVAQEVDEETVVTHYAILLDERDAIAQRLYEQHRIFIGLWHVHHTQDLYGSRHNTLPVCESLEKRIAFLPFHTKLTEEDVAFICQTLRSEISA